MAKTITFILPGNAGTQTTPPVVSKYTTDRKRIRFNFAADVSYPNGGGGVDGYPIAPADLGLVSQIDFLDIIGEFPSGGPGNVTPFWNRALQKMQFQVVSTGAAVANNTDLHLCNFDCIAEGI